MGGARGTIRARTLYRSQLAHNYAFAGRLSEAEEFGRLLALRNHLGLFSEEYDSNRRRQISNFPQAFSHLALILTAQNIENNLGMFKIAA